jgi:hypothetical protein
MVRIVETDHAEEFDRMSWHTLRDLTYRPCYQQCRQYGSEAPGWATMKFKAIKTHAQTFFECLIRDSLVETANPWSSVSIR